MPNRGSCVVAVSITLWLLAATAPAQERWLDAPAFTDPALGRLELLADVDQDGDQDAIAFASGAASFTVAVNDGSGRLNASQVVALPGGASTTLFVAADLDGDLDDDVVVAAGAGLAIHHGAPGATFAAMTWLPLPGNVIALRVGDGNGDGIDDLFVTHAVSGGPSQSRWLFGGVGVPPILGPGAVLPGSFQTVVCDVDGDGKDDPVTTEDNLVGSGWLRLFVTTPTGFALHASVALPASLLTQLTPIDYDHDGDVDVLTVIAGNLRLASNDNGTWSLGAPYTIGQNPDGVHAGDWDGDGIPELMLRLHPGVGARYLELLHQESPGSWLVTRVTPIASVPIAKGAGFVDLDNDGHVDFVDSDVVVFGDGSLYSANGGGWTAPNEDWDGDGDADFATGATVFVNDGRGTLTPFELARPALPPGIVWGAIVGTCDLDGDGLHEQLIGKAQTMPFGSPVFLGVELLREQPDHTFADAGPAAAPGQSMQSGQFTDADDDGDLDLVTAQGVWQNDGANFFTLQSAPGTFRPIAQGDVDGDGDIDLLGAGTGAGPTLAILRRTAPGVYTTEVLYSPPTTTVTDTPGLLADLDDDGDLDVAGLQQASGVLRTVVFANLGGTFAPAVTIPFGGRPVAGDVDGDGLTDLAISVPGRLRVLRRTGPGLVYAAPVDFALFDVHALTDFDQDGDLDACGFGFAANRRFVEPTSGLRRQYGTGSAGTGGRRPLLSVTGAIRPGLTPSIRLVAAPGGMPALLLVGTGPNDAPSVILPGVQSYVSGLYLILGYTAGGAPGQAGAGSLEVPVAIPPAAAGLDLYLEFLVVDPAVPGLLANSNGCAMHVGQ